MEFPKVLLTQDFFQREAEQILRDLLFIYTGVEYELEQVAFGVPLDTGLVQWIDGDENTVVPVFVAIEDDWRFDGVMDMLYRRFRFNEVGVNHVYGDFSFPLSVHAVLPIINEQCGLMLSTDDIVEFVYDSPTSEIVLQAQPGSLIWTGGCIVGLRESILKNRSLDGFYPVPFLMQ